MNMTTEHFQFMDILGGKRLKLTLTNASYIGTLTRVNHDKSIVLTDVADVNDGRKYPGAKLFFGREIVNVEFPLETKTDSGQKPVLERCLTREELQPCKKNIFEDDDECVNYVVIDVFNERFWSAVKDINNEQVIGVAACQHRLCWLQIATKCNVYLFDIVLLGAQFFKNGLSRILENERIIKVMHDCRDIAGCLMAQFGVNLTNVFDTQVADVMCFYSETGHFLPDRVSTLQEVVSLYLKVPSSTLSSLEMKSQFTKEKDIWFRRPCPSPLLKMMALSVVYLRPIRLVQLDTLMADYVTLVDSYLRSSHKGPGEVEHSSGMELPWELKQLEHMHQERKEQALAYYPVTEQGLLCRFNSSPQPLCQSSPPAESHTQDPERQIQPKSHSPAILEPPSSAQANFSYNQSSGSAQWVTNVASVQSTTVSLAAMPSGSIPAAHVPVLGPVPVLAGQPSLNGTVSADGSPGHKQIMMGTMGRGRPLETALQPSFPVFPSMGRSFTLQNPRPQVPKEIPGAMKTPGKVEMVPPKSQIHQDEVTPCPAWKHPCPGERQLHPNSRVLPPSDESICELFW